MFHGISEEMCFVNFQPESMNIANTDYSAVLSGKVNEVSWYIKV